MKFKNNFHLPDGNPGLGKSEPSCSEGRQVSRWFLSSIFVLDKWNFFQMMIILNYVSLSCFNQTSKGNKCVSVLRRTGPWKSWSLLVGLCQVILVRMNLISSFWNGGAWGSKPWSPIFVLQVGCENKPEDRTGMFLPPPRPSFRHIWVNDRPTTHSSVLGHHDAVP